MLEEILIYWLTEFSIVASEGELIIESFLEG